MGTRGCESWPTKRHAQFLLLLCSPRGKYVYTPGIFRRVADCHSWAVLAILPRCHGAIDYGNMLFGFLFFGAQYQVRIGELSILETIGGKREVMLTLPSIEHSQRG
jgi:hypothetical protein